ncbi:MAG: HNH endonuclease signature motif containing protein, partial [Acidimicrobiales bacterium]
LGKRHRPHLNVVVNEPDLREEAPGRTLSGTPLPGLVVRKLACDANIHRVITDGLGSILDYGRATRSIPPAVYTSLVLRDWGCRFPGCDRPAEWCEGHHVWHWEDGGPTNLSNLVLLCSKHHHVIHLPDWRLELKPDGTLEATYPHVTRRTSDPPRRAAAA